MTSNICIGVAYNSAYKLNIGGDININGSLYQNNNLFVTSRWTKDATNNISYTSGNVSIGTNTSYSSYRLNVEGNTYISNQLLTSNICIGVAYNSAYKLNIGGDININGNIYQNTTLFTGSRWTKDANNNISYTNGNVLIGTSIPSSQKLYVNGEAYLTGSLTTDINIQAKGDVISSFSDIRLKNIISKIDNPMEKLMHINTFKYIPNNTALLLGAIPLSKNKVQIGLSAQDVQNVLPEVINLAPFDSSNLENGDIVSKSGKNYLTVSYERIVPLLIECIKELKNENIQIKKMINERY